MTRPSTGGQKRDRGRGIMPETLLDEERAAPSLRLDATITDWRTGLRADLDGAFERGAGKWSRAIAAVAWIHLGCFLVCQAIYQPDVPRDARHFYIWVVEFFAVLAAMRAIAGPRWMKSSAAIGVAARLWITFLILSFNVVSLNELTGWDTRWYRPVWGTLSTFLLASMAWLFSLRMFVLAVQMYFTGLLMLYFKHLDNLIYGVSWWMALMAISFRIRAREKA